MAAVDAKQPFAQPLIGSLNESLRIHRRYGLDSIGFGCGSAIRRRGRTNATA